MKLSPFEGFIIPGLHFENCTIWVLSWDTNPTPFEGMVEVWVLWYNGKKTCFISPAEAEVVFKKYHDFDEIIPADIQISESKSCIQIDVNVDSVSVLSLELLRRKTLKYGLLNLILKYGNKEKIAEKGKTETGMAYKSIPKKITSLIITNAKLNDENIKLIAEPNMYHDLGDGKPAKEPIVNYCIHLLEG